MQCMLIALIACSSYSLQNDLERKLKAVEEELQQEHDRHLISLTDLERKHAQVWSCGANMSRTEGCPAGP